ncbi:hypothetical protein [Streptomyces sp. NPDC051219]
MEYISLDAQVGEPTGVLDPARYLEQLPPEVAFRRRADDHLS